MATRFHAHAHRLWLFALLAAVAATPEASAEPPTSPATSKASGATAPGTPSAPPAQVEDCPPARRVKVKPPELKKQVRAATTAAELKKLLEPLGLWSENKCSEDGKPAMKLDVFRARIMSADVQDFILQARGEVCTSEKLLDGVVLHPLSGKDTFCAIHMGFLPGALNYYQYNDSTTFGFENLTDPVRQVFRVEKHSEGPHSSDEEISYWEAQEGSLRSIFSITAENSAWIVSSYSSEVKVTPVGDEFPRQLDIKESVKDCGNVVEMPSGERVQVSGDCSEAENEKRMCYRRSSPQGPASYEECPG